MGVIGTILFFLSLIVISFRKNEFLGISKSVWLTVGYCMFSLSFMFMGFSSFDTGSVSINLFDNPFLNLRFTRENNPILFYIVTIGAILVGAIGLIATITHSPKKK